MSFRIGNKGEDIVRDYFEALGYEVTPSPDRKFYDYDLACSHFEYNFTVEVKTDVSAYSYAERRGEPNNPRLFVEYYNDTTNQPSGIAMSNATYYFYLMVKNGQNVECNVFDTRKLHDWLMESDTRTHTLIPRYNDHVTTGWLPYLRDLDEAKLIKKQWIIGKW